jgi:phasin family protein
MDQMLAAQKRTVEALNEAGKIYVAGVQTYGRKQAELARGNMDEAAALTKAVMAEKTLDKQATLYFEQSKAGFEKGVAAVRELGEIVAKTNREAADVLGKAFAAYVETAKKAA